MVDCLKLLNRGLDFEIFHLTHDGLAPSGTDDTVWISGLDQRYECVITRDHNLRTRPKEKEAWAVTPRIVFFLGAAWTKRKPMIMQTAMLLKWWPTILETAHNATPGQGYTVQWQETIKPLERRY